MRKGETKQPWPCCGKPAPTCGRPSVGVCEECGSLIEDGKAARAKAAAERKAGDLGVFGWTSVNYGWPRFYGNGASFPHSHGDAVDLHEQLADAFYDLVGVLSQPAPSDTPHHSPKYEMRKMGWTDTKERYYLPWPMVLDEPPNGRSYGSSNWQFHQLVLMKTAARNAVAKLHQAINAALEGVYLEGKERGGSALLQLASGSMTMNDFDKAIHPRKDRDR